MNRARPPYPTRAARPRSTQPRGAPRAALIYGTSLRLRLLCANFLTKLGELGGGVLDWRLTAFRFRKNVVEFPGVRLRKTMFLEGMSDD